MNNVYAPKIGDFVLVKNYQGLSKIQSIPKTGMAHIIFIDHATQTVVPFHHLTLKLKGETK